MSDPAKLLADPEFRALASRKTRISVQLTIVILVIYYGFIFLLAFKKDLFGHKVTQNITLGIPIGIGVIVASWILTGIYVRWANQRYDGMVDHLKSRLHAGTDDHRVS